MNKDHNTVWRNCLEIIKDNVSPISFRTWFEPIVPEKLNGDVLTIQVPSAFFYEYLEEQYIDIIAKTLRKEIGDTAKLEYSVVMEVNTVASNNSRTVKYPTKNQIEINKAPGMKPENAGIKNPFVIPGIKNLDIDPNLNTNFSFSTYVEGDCNKLARSAAIAVSKQPGGTAFNPFFLYGNSGLGKTHLVQAIGMEVKKAYPEKNVLYLSANRFMTQYTEAVRNNNINDFLHFYQMIDLLIIDDVQEFAGKASTQDTFFHIFNHLHQSGKQLILTSDKPPVELQGLEQRLLSRFKWGLAADIQSPDYDTRIAILKQKSYNDGMTIPEEVIEFIATNITSNIRELEGALISLLAQSTLNKKEVTLELAAQIVDRLVKNTRKDISVDYVQKVVCEHFGLTSEQLKAKTRKREIVQARQIAMYFSKSLTKSSLSSIGAQIGGKDHATVLHACKTVANLIDTDKRFKLHINDIEKKLKI
ncbi:MAG: chromosomal replication initiator protein DnaA [Bacteroidales bacterium]|jgi:chromosomal replication initiator protein|nr:chromosomal replication initiator protein DnaA [Bacteroidales bacterium]